MFPVEFFMLVKEWTKKYRIQRGVLDTYSSFWGGSLIERVLEYESSG